MIDVFRVTFLYLKICIFLSQAVGTCIDLEVWELQSSTCLSTARVFTEFPRVSTAKTKRYGMYFKMCYTCLCCGIFV